MLKSHHRTSIRRTTVSLAVILSMGLFGCGESKVSQCNRLAEMVNQTETFMQQFETEMQTFSVNAANVKSLEDIKTAATQYTEAVDKVVDNLDGLAGELEATELSDETLTRFRNEYIGVMRGFSTALQQASSAMGAVQTVETEADLPDQIEQSQEEMMAAVQSIQDLSQQETQIIENVNEYCGATPTAESAPTEPTAPDPAAPAPAE